MGFRERFFAMPPEFVVHWLARIVCGIEEVMIFTSEEESLDMGGIKVVSCRAFSTRTMFRRRKERLRKQLSCRISICSSHEVH